MVDYVKFKGRNWFLNVTRNMSVFTNAIATCGYIKHFKKYYVQPFEAIYIIKNGRMSYALCNRENIDRYFKDLDKFYKKPLLIEKLKTAYHKNGKDLWKASSNLLKNPDRKNFEKFIHYAEIHYTGLFPTTAIGIHFPQLLRVKIKQVDAELTDQELDILISDLTYPGKQTPLTKSQKKLLEIGAELQKNKLKASEIEKNLTLSTKLDRFMRDYSFIPVNFLDDPWTKEEIIHQLEKLIKKDCRKEIEKIKNYHAIRIRQRKDLLKKVNDKEIENIAKSIQIATYLNEYRKYVICFSSLAYRPILKKISSRYGLKNWQECTKFTPEEIKKIYFDKNERIIKTLKSRNEVGICFSKNKLGYQMLTPKEIKLLSPIFEKMKNITSSVSVSEIKGIIANKGTIQGIARVINGKNEFHKFQDGDIIVTAMTSVDFVPLMKRASAYVTNEGGITSHAAIVSRELDKPCLVGTKNATEILKDGDLVEVDANEGVVKILKRK